MSVKCTYHDDCRSNNNGECVCLNNTDFPNRNDCPFYKTNEQFNNEQRRSIDRLRLLGRWDLLKKYHGIDDGIYNDSHAVDSTSYSAIRRMEIANEK